MPRAASRWHVLTIKWLWNWENQESLTLERRCPVGLQPLKRVSMLRGAA